MTYPSLKIYCDQPLKELAEKQARDEGRSVSSYVRQLIVRDKVKHDLEWHDAIDE